MIETLSSIYGRAAAWRRAWYLHHPEWRNRLARPVISVGNLRVGGSLKTPVVAYIARLLLDRGERPAVLSRGYARRAPQAGATVVSDGTSVLADLDAAGDEPLMLARSIAGAMVIVGADRYVAGCLAERRLGATVHILDDGFQHFELARDLDLLLACEEDLRDRPLPAGRLRETVAAASYADVAIVDALDLCDAERVGRALGLEMGFQVIRALGSPRQVCGAAPANVPPGARVLAVAGIARPERFFADVASAGWQVAGTMVFRDHHPFDTRDLARIAAASSNAGARAVVTTEKDAVRFQSSGANELRHLALASIPLNVTIEPAERFRTLLFERLGRAT